LLSFVERSFGTAAGVFWIYAAVCVFAVLFGYWIVPERQILGRDWKVVVEGFNT
jgi:hypothetical protein